MPRNFKFLRRNSGKDQDVEEIENVPINPNDLSSIQALNPKPSVEQVGSVKRKCEWTPVNARSKMLDTATLPVSTPERPGTGNVGRKRLALASAHEYHDAGQSQMANYFSQSVSTRNGSSLNLTPRVGGTAGRAYRGHSERDCASTQNTPAKSVSKPPNPGFAPFSSLRHPGSARAGNYAALSRRFSVSSGQLCTVNTVEVPHFDLKEDPTFWMDHNVQVIIRVRPLNSFEISTHGYNRCVKQENAQSITWIGQPETRFTFDHVACETVEQEMLFRMSGLPMVENCLSGYNSCMFAYGQTGSGKTYTMLGEMEDLEFKPSSHRGMTPRIFEFLFARISAEEESRRDEKLKYSCKCSFLEIYNEQIADLLDPTSTNLLIREDVKKGVYVENLSEFEVCSVSDVPRLLIQGSSNRKVAATDMNRESSRSHSVFTCVVESKWERDSTTNLRFARLNLVDLAGSERQKSSGAEGERLKEAANINKSLSTLGHVIMLLVDIAQGKPKHVPCRDSRLTFLLQDSLGGNSKTMIIANISPSICCAAETLNTLKFAQRAKLIQNNAVVNEDSSGDVAALQHQIWLLREELSSLKRQNVSRRLAFDPFSTMGEQENTDTEIRSKHDEVKADNLMLKSMEKMLAGALRREQIAEASIKELKAEIEQLNLLVHQREEDTKCTKMMLKFREDKIKRMEALLGDLKPLDAYLLEENAYLSEEIQLLRSKFDKNPEVTRFASENIRLQEQLRRFQDFYEEGERDILMKEISELRSQLIHFFDNNKHQHDPNMDQVSTHNIEGNGSVHSELTDSLKELTECRIELKSSSERNAKLSREIEDLHALLRNKKTDMNDHHGIVKAVKDTEVPCVVDQVFGADKCRSKHVMATNVEEILNLELELDILKIMLKEERLSRGKMEEMIASLIQDAELAEERLLFVSLQSDGAKRDLKEAKSVIEALESQQLLSINEIEDLKNCNDHYLELLHKQELEISALKEQTVRSRYARFRPSELKESPLQVQLKRMQASLDKAKNLNMWYQNDHDAQRTNEEEMDNIRQQVEAETAYVIVSLQEELSMLQHRVQESDMKEREAENKLLILESNLKELQETLDTMSQDNELLNQNLQEKDIEIRSLKEDWEILSSEIEGALFEGHETLGNVCDQVDSFSCPLSDKRVWVSEQTGRMIRDISEKESIIQELNRCLEDANVRANDMEHMLLSLRGAAIVLTESHEQDCCEKEEEIVQLRSELSRKTYAIVELEQRLKLGYDEVRKASTCATAAFVVVNRLSEINSSHLDAFRVMDIQLRELQEMHQKKDGSPFEKSAAFKEAQRKIEPLEASCNNCISLRQQLHKQQRYISTLERRFMENDKSAFGKTLKILEDYEMEVSMGRPTMDDCAEHIGYPERNSCHGIMLFNRFCGALQRPRTATGYEIHEVDSSLAVQLGAGASNTVLRSGENRALVAHDSSEVINIFDNSSKIDTSVILLGNEIGSAVGSLKETQAEIAHLSDVKKEIYLSEGKACEDIEAALETQVLSIQAAFGEFEKQCESKMLILNHKLHIVDECAQEAKSSWSRTKELHKSELVDAKSTMDQQTAEFFSLLAEFEEAQDKMKEADVMINELTVTNEKMKLETENMKKANIMLTTERDSLITEVQELQSSYALRDQNYKNLEEQFEWSVSNITSLAEDLVRSASEAEGTYQEALTSIVHNFNSLKSQIQDVLKWMHLSFEEISLEILAKDCALSVSYICHIGILLDAIIGLQPENSLLHVGIRESDAVICNLRENNMKSEEELQKCQMLDSKLSADIRNNLFCLSSKESETRELSMKLSSFKEKSEILRHQEELMLERSNIMGSELAVSTEKLDQSNSTVTVSLLEQERLLKFSNEEDMKSQVEIFMLELAAKDFQLLNLVSELQQLAHRNADMEKEHLVCCSALDYLVADVVTLRIVVDLRKELFSERETQIICLQIEVEEAKDGEAKVLNQLHKLEEEYVTLKESLNMKEKENESFKNKLQEMESSNCYLLEDIQEKNLESNSVMGCIDMLKLQNCRLEVDISNLESRIALLEKDLKLKKTKLDDTSETLSKRSQDLENCRVKMNAVQDENLILTDELLHLRQSYCELLRTSTSKVVKCIYSVGTADVQSCSMLEQLDENLKMLLDKISHDACQNLDVVSVFLQELEFLDSNVKGLVSEKLSLQEQLSRKDEVLNGLLFDLRLLRENAANNKDQMDEIGKLAATLKSAEDELAIRSSELDDAIANGQNLGVKLKEQTDMITTLEMDLEKANNSLKLLSDENMGLGSHIDVIMAARASVEQELTEKRRVVDGLEKELLEMTLGQMNDLVESLKSNLVEVSGEKDQLQKEVMALEEKVGTALALAKENETIAAESQEVAESRRIYAEEKEEEVKLLESSVLELGSTIAALEKKVDILKKEAERQQTKREALESELHSLKSQMHHIESADDIKRHLDEKAKNLQEALEHLEIVEEDLLKKDREIAQCKTHIAELTVQAEGQASRLCRAESFLLRVMEELVQYRVSNGISSSITFDEVQRLNKKLKGTEKDKLRLVETLLGLFANFSKAAGGTISISKSNDYASEEALKQSGVSGDET